MASNLVLFPRLQIIISLIQAFSDTVSNGKKYLINSVYAIFFSELLTSPLLAVSDSWGNFQRHVWGPRAFDQRRVNLRFRGGFFELSERYTVRFPLVIECLGRKARSILTISSGNQAMTKLLFLTFFYSAVFPGGFFFTAVSLIVVYYTDKFCLFVSSKSTRSACTCRLNCSFVERL